MNRNHKTKSFTYWLLAFVFTLLIAYFQRKTGPTHPVRGKYETQLIHLDYKLLRSHSSSSNAVIALNVTQGPAQGVIRYKRLNSPDDWTSTPLEPKNNQLLAQLPKQPPAGKLQYEILIEENGQLHSLTKKPISIRFKGDVPATYLIPHIILMFLAMLFSTRTGLEVLIKGKNTYSLTWITTLLFLFGGLVFGPIVQKYAFGDYWTGWPFGQDLTDNKVAVSFLFWLIALISLYRKKTNTKWALIAALVLLATYLVPHSALGSEFDYEKGVVTTGK